MENSFDLCAGWLIDGTGEPAMRNILLRVVDGMISSIEDAGQLRCNAPTGPAGIDFSTSTIIPALVDSHVHLTMSGSTDPEIRKQQLSYSFEQNSPLMDLRIDKYLRFGILALRDGGDGAGHGLRYRKEQTESPPVFFKAAGAGFRANGRYGKLIAITPDQSSSLAECIQRHDPMADHIKIVNSGLNSLTEYGRQTAPQFSGRELDEAVRMAGHRGRKVMVHANGLLPVKESIHAGPASIEHGFFMGTENMEQMAERRIFWVPTAFSMKSIALNMPAHSIEAQIAARNFDHQLEQIRKARELGVRVILGTDSGGFGLHHAESFGQELKILIEAGFNLEQAIRCASVEACVLLGIEDELGPVKAGSPATFIVVPGPPSQLPDSLNAVHSIYIRGVKKGF